MISIAQTCRRGFALLLILATSSAARADADIEREAQLTAAYVFNFMKFVAWPEHVPDNAYQVCFAGAPDVRDALAKATVNKRIGARSIDVRSLDGEESAEGCHVIYICQQAQAAQRPLRDSAALTIGEAPGFLREGGIVRLYTENNRLRFAISAENARRAGLTVSSDLLKLATYVEQGARR